MATKKQKREAMQQRREAFEAEIRETGRRALEADRKRREIETRKAWEKGHEKHHKFVDECPICSEIKAQKAEEDRRAAIEKVAQARERSRLSANV